MINKIKNNVFQFSFREFGSCVYFLKIKSGKNILIDTSTKENREELLKDLQELGIKKEDIDVILLTHRHYDHVGNLNLFENAVIYDFKNIGEIAIKEIKIIKTPGHSKDSVCFLYKDILFSGDTLFHKGIGRTDLPDSEPEKMQNSIDELKKIKYNILCPGHVD